MQLTLIETESELDIENFGVLTQPKFTDILTIDKRKYPHVLVKLEEMGGLYSFRAQILESVDVEKLSPNQVKWFGTNEWRPYFNEDIKPGERRYIYLRPNVERAIVQIQTLPPPSGPSSPATVNARARSILGAPEHPRDYF